MNNDEDAIWRKIQLQRELEHADSSQLARRISRLITSEPDLDERELMLDLVKENLGGKMCACISSEIRKLERLEG